MKRGFILLGTGLLAYTLASSQPREEMPDIPVSAHSPAIPAAPEPEFLDKVRAVNEGLYANLESFICSERIERYRGKLGAQSGRQLDTITARVAFEHGAERYSDITERGRSLLGFATLTGAWSQGEFGTLLLQTESLLRTQQIEMRASSDTTAVLSFDVSEEDSPWDLEVSSRHYRVPFHTDVTVSRPSGQILRIARTSTRLPADVRISQLRWNVELGAVELSGKSWLLPTTGEYAVLYNEYDRRDWNLLTFSGYQRFDVQVSLRFN